MAMPAGLEIRPVSDEEAPAFFRTTGIAFAAHMSDSDVEHERIAFHPERSLAVFEGGRIVATAGAFPFDLTLPGLRTTPMEGVTAVGVLPTHRRRGILTSMMRQQLDDIHAAGVAVAGLTASESIIYGRFGYGLASSLLQVEIDKVHSRFVRPVADQGRCVLVDRSEAAKVLPELYDRARLGRVGELNRFDRYWDSYFADAKYERRGASARFYVVHESAAGEPDGYLAYRTREHSQHGLSGSAVEVSELRAFDSATEIALWRFALDVDLMDRVRASSLALDDPLRWMLADPRRLRVTGAHDHLWIRLVDLAPALEARAYEAEDDLVLDVDDPFCDWNSGRWKLQTGPDGASCTRAPKAKKADLSLSTVELGAAYLGGVAISTLARARRVEELKAGALRRADRVFASEQVPWCTTGF
jgi:predicted acetyltransferase